MNVFTKLNPIDQILDTLIGGADDYINAPELRKIFEKIFCHAEVYIPLSTFNHKCIVHYCGEKEEDYYTVNAWDKCLEDKIPIVNNAIDNIGYSIYNQYLLRGFLVLYISAFPVIDYLFIWVERK